MTNFIKPEIAAPGVITAAAYGTGTGLVTYQGTSMASPMVAGSAALVKQARPDMSGREVKALLVNNADTEVRDKVAIWGGELAPITRVGGGEVHVDRAIMAPAAAWENHTMQPSLSFGFVEAANRTRTILRTIQVKNYTNAPITYQVSYTFRYANDEAMDAVSLNIKGVDVDGMVTVPADGMVLIPVELNILSTALPMWGMDSGALGSLALR
jgi:hypothetical protein